MELNISGIKCDAQGCNFKDETVKFEDYDKWLNKPCPLCGANLLTKEDYDYTKFLIKAAAELQKKYPENKNDKQYKLKIELNGTGKPNMTIIPLNKKPKFTSTNTSFDITKSADEVLDKLRVNKNPVKLEEVDWDEIDPKERN